MVTKVQKNNYYKLVENGLWDIVYISITLDMGIDKCLRKPLFGEQNLFSERIFKV